MAEDMGWILDAIFHRSSWVFLEGHLALLTYYPKVYGLIAATT
jgi:hypothetical protein